MYRFHLFFSSLCVLVLGMLVSCNTSHTLFHDGVSEYTIVLDGQTSGIEQYAAQELQYWVEQVSGVSLSIVNGPAEGKCLILSTLDPGGREDGFVYYSKGADIHFEGRGPRGTLYSVYSFLEEELGCRWYSSKVSVAPHQDSWKFGKLRREETPGILIRDNCVLDVRSNPVFSARMRNNFIRIPSPDGKGTLEGSAEGYWGVHALGYFLPANQYFATHPEYFCLRNGQRYGGYGQPCLSNPDVLQIVIEGVRRVMREQPDYLIYSVEQQDDQLYCECDACQGLSAKYGGESGVMVWFVNQVADAVREEFPDKFIGTFAYQYTRHAPKDIVPRDNVVIRLCSIECCLLHPYDACEQNQAFLKDLEEWSAIAPHLYIWDYVTDFSQYTLPVANWKSMQPHIRDFVDNHAIGILEEGDYQTVSCELRELRSWVLSKLMWNPDASMDELILDFTEGYYGPAGRYVREYLDLEERILMREGMHRNCYIGAADEIYTDEFIREGRRIFAGARKAVAGNPELLDRVETAEMPLCFLQMYKNPLWGFNEKADEVVRRTVEREGMDRLAEGAWAGGFMTVKNLLEHYDKLKEDLGNAESLPASLTSAPAEKGFRYVRYEGDFLSTTEMIRRGKVVDQGLTDHVFIDEDPETDHFGYVFKGVLEIPQEGMYQLRVLSDDGAVVFLDGKPMIAQDGSHSPQLSIRYLRLEKGYHSCEIRYFEDCEGQELDVTLMGEDGSDALIFL